MAHILVVDDEDVVREMIVCIFQSVGHRVSEARDGAHAIEVLQDVAPDMVLTDINMPVMNGRRFLERVRTQFPGMPCAAMSSESEGTGFDGFIRKPFQITDLLEMVGQILERRQAESRRR